MISSRLKNLLDALEFYKSRGYQEIEVPWIVSHEAMSATIPPWSLEIKALNHGSIVASGEQSFIQMWLDGKLPDGKYCCCTPCFRDETNLSDLTRLYFMKVELIEVGNWDADLIEAPLDNILHDALTFHSLHIGDARYVETDIGCDIFSGDIELGSYGYRQFGKMKWIYGTGCAEPRFSYCKKRL